MASLQEPSCSVFDDDDLRKLMPNMFASTKGMRPSRRDRRCNKRQGTGRITADRGLFGTQGRRTGLLLKENVVKDSDGLDNIDDFWASDIDNGSDEEEAGILRDENMGAFLQSAKRREARLGSRRKGTGRSVKPRAFGRDLQQLPRLEAECLDKGLPNSDESSPEKTSTEENSSEASPEPPAELPHVSAAGEAAENSKDKPGTPGESRQHLMSPGESEETASVRRSLTVVDAMCQIPTGGLLLRVPWWEQGHSPAGNASKQIDAEKDAGPAMEADMDVDGGSPGGEDCAEAGGDDISDGEDAAAGDGLGPSLQPTADAPPPAASPEKDMDYPARELFADHQDEAHAAEDEAIDAGIDVLDAGGSDAAAAAEVVDCREADGGEDAGGVGAALTPSPAPAQKPRAAPRDTHVRLREQVKRRQSLAQLPRGARKRSRPLQYWRNERAVFERKESTSLPTVARLVLRSPDPLWPRPRGRTRAAQAKVAKGSHPAPAE